MQVFEQEVEEYTNYYNPLHIFDRTRLVQTCHVTEFSPTGEYPSDITQFLKPHVLRNTIASIWREFVLGHYLFLKAHIFPRTTLSENCPLLGTVNVRGQISEHISVPNGHYCLYMNTDKYCNSPQVREVTIIISTPKNKIPAKIQLFLI